MRAGQVANGLHCSLHIKATAEATRFYIELIHAGPPDHIGRYTGEASVAGNGIELIGNVVGNEINYYHHNQVYQSQKKDFFPGRNIIVVDFGRVGVGVEGKRLITCVEDHRIIGGDRKRHGKARVQITISAGNRMKSIVIDAHVQAGNLRVIVD